MPSARRHASPLLTLAAGALFVAAAGGCEDRERPPAPKVVQVADQAPQRDAGQGQAQREWRRLCVELDALAVCARWAATRASGWSTACRRSGRSCLRRSTGWSAREQGGAAVQDMQEGVGAALRALARSVGKAREEFESGAGSGKPGSRALQV